MSMPVEDPSCIEDITPVYLTAILQRQLNQPNLVVCSYTCTTLKPGLISGLSGGLHRLHLTYEGPKSINWPQTVILKANPSDATVHAHMTAKARQRGLDHLVPLMPNLGFNLREVMCYRTLPGQVTIDMPRVYHTVLDEPGNRLWIFMEDIDDLDFVDTWDDVSLWDTAQLCHVMEELADFHATWWGRTQRWEARSWLLRYPSPANWADYVRAAISVNAQRHPRFVTASRLPMLERLVDKLPQIIEELQRRPRTLIHGDCTPRNACLRPTFSGHRLILYDWALAAIRGPQEDLVKFLLFVLDPCDDSSEVQHLLDIYLSRLPQHIMATTSRAEFSRRFEASCLFSLSVYLTVCCWRDEVGLEWLFREFEHRLRLAEQVADRWLT